MSSSLYPWQLSDYTELLRLRNRLPNALLLNGLRGLGSEVLAISFIRSLLCSNPNAEGSYCNKCNSCILFSLDSHPDYYPLGVAEDEKSISIAAIRSVVDFLSFSTHLGRYKIVFIQDAEALNLNSANALLKILEEPPEYALFVLLSDNIQQLLPTIVSRCQKYKLTAPDKETAKNFLQAHDVPEVWLALNHNCPIFTPEIDAEQLATLIKTLSEPGVELIYGLSSVIDFKNNTFIFEFLTKWLGDLISYKMSGELTYFDQYFAVFETLKPKLNLDKSFFLLDKLNFLLQWSNHPLNYKLQIENLLFKYQGVFSS